MESAYWLLFETPFENKAVYLTYTVVIIGVLTIYLLSFASLFHVTECNQSALFIFSALIQAPEITSCDWIQPIHIHLSENKLINTGPQKTTTHDLISVQTCANLLKEFRILTSQ